MPGHVQRQRLAQPQPGSVQPALRAMLEARSVAVVGASGRPGSFGERMVAEVGKSPARPVTYLVNPRYRELAGGRCYPSLRDLPGPVDLVLLGVPDAALEEQLLLAAERGDRSAVIFGNAYEEPLTQNQRTGRLGQGDSGLRLNASSPDHPGPDAGLRTPCCADPTDHSGTMNRTGPAGPSGTADHSDSAARPGLRERLAGLAESGGMELCGAGCMGFVNVGYGLRAIGYVEPDPLPAGPVALVTHSGSVFSALLRTRRAIGFTLAVSSGQELVTAAGSYLRYALEQPTTRVLALVLEAIRQPAALRSVLAAAAERDLPVVMLTAGTSATGKAMVAAHSGALAAADGGWEALARAYGIHRVGDLAEMADTLELFALRTRHRPHRPAGHMQAQTNGLDDPLHPIERVQRVIEAIDVSSESGGDPWVESGIGVNVSFRDVGGGRGIATVHDSGLERAHAVDLADDLGVPFAEIGAKTRARLTDLLDPGLLPSNPLDVWGNGAGTRELFAGSLIALAEDDAVDAVALAVDLVTELDGDDAYQLAVLDVAGRTDKPVAVLSNLPSAIDSGTAAMLRRAGVPVLEGLRTGLLALRHLLDHQARARRRSSTSASPQYPITGSSGLHHGDQMTRVRELLAAGLRSGAPQLALLREYGIRTARTLPAADLAAVLGAAAEIGYPVVLKTDEPAIAHKSDARGVITGIGSAGQLTDAYADIAARLGPAALVCEQVAAGIELALGIVRDHALGPLLIVGAGGVLVELLADRAVVLPPVSQDEARELLAGLRIGKLLGGVRGAGPADLDAVTHAITALSQLAIDLADQIEALDINPLICGPQGATAVDALVIRAGPSNPNAAGDGHQRRADYRIGTP